MSKPMGLLSSALAIAVLSGCKFAPAEPVEAECECSEGADEQGDLDAEPTASIFGPEAELPEPEAALETLTVTIGFPDGGNGLDADAMAALDSVIKSDQIKEGGPVILRAHSDAGGSDSANLDASQERGLAVAKWLIDNGVKEGRIAVIAFGEQNPSQPNALPDGSASEEGRAANRRVEIELPIETVTEAVDANKG